MPTHQCRWLHDDEGLSPIEEAAEPDQRHTDGVGGTPGLGVTLLIQRELFAQKEIFCRQGWAGAQTEAQKAPGITHKREEYACKRQEAAKPLGASGHRQSIPLRQKVAVLGYYPSWDPHRPEQFRHQCDLGSPVTDPLMARRSNNCGAQVLIIVYLEPYIIATPCSPRI
jgi:hypothetical protein